VLGATFEPVAEAGSISFADGTAAADSTCTVKFNVTVPATGSGSYNATDVSDDSTATYATTGLTIAKSVMESQFTMAGDVLHYSFLGVCAAGPRGRAHGSCACRSEARRGGDAKASSTRSNEGDARNPRAPYGLQRPLLRRAPPAALSLLNDATASPSSRAPCIRACGARNAVTWSCRAGS